MINDDFPAHRADGHEDAQERESPGREQVHDRNDDAGGAAEQATNDPERRLSDPARGRVADDFRVAFRLFTVWRLYDN